MNERNDKPPAAPGRAWQARSLGEFVNRAIAPVVARRTGMTASLHAAWPELAGPNFAECTRAERIRWPRRASDDDPFEPGTLIVACEGPQALFLQHESGQLVERLNRFFGFHAIAAVKIVQKPVARRRETAPAPVRLDPDQRRRLGEALAGVDDPQLRASLERLGRGVMTRSGRHQPAKPRGR